MRSQRLLIIVVLSLLLLPLFTLVGKEVVVNHRGTRVDFFAIWYGNNLILNRTSPYSPDATLVIHEKLSGRPLGPGVYVHSFAYPAYLAVVLFPIALLPYSTAFLIWTGLQLPMLFIALFLLIRFLKIQLNILGWVILLVGGSIGFSFPLVSYALGQISILLLFLLALTFFFLQEGKQTEAGIMLALTAIRPDIFFIAGAASIIFMWNSNRDIKRLALATIVSFILINLVSVFLLGFWYQDWVNMLMTYSVNNPKAHWPLEIIPNAAVQIGIVIALIVYLCWQFFQVYREPTQNTKLLAISTLFLVYSTATKVTGTYHMTLLLIPALIILSFYSQRNLQWVALAALFSPWLYRFIPVSLRNDVWISPFFVPISFLILQTIYLMIASKFTTASQTSII